MRILKSEKGMTLVEVIISIAILGIIVTAFLSLFGNGFVSIASFGGKSEAVLGASDILEQVYSESESYTESELEDKLVLLDGVKKDNVGNIEDSIPEGKGFNYYFEDADLNGFNLTIAVQNGKKGSMEKLTTFIPKTPEAKKDES
ncbi:hypothetical protein EUAN_11070 [Andreesenia angusta]|uniref:Uncharacterized protein n=1 Tax=Andreesenia angusta TaxID=39480 RepID=A0A1S1V7K5_9FIRM|nr:prepilin-type N-terminal cleavage/methylation domain-containing protein [Andreesenia angusta]OHW62542.1 hypothetical protein EUAN_11070 [Andreesenia angusta]